MKNGKIGVTTENIFPVIKKFLYSDHEIFLRELISNAVDATQKLKTLSSMGEAKGELGDLAIRVAADKERKTLTVTDRGVGMTAEEVDRYINQIAFSGAEEFMAKYKDQAIIGHFGLGFYSAFMVSDKVEIVTRCGRRAPDRALELHRNARIRDGRDRRGARPRHDDHAVPRRRRARIRRGLEN